MAIELTQWNPRAGDSGNAKYDVPGAASLDGGIAAGDGFRNEAGGEVYSEVPTNEEVAAGRGVNQAVALLQRLYGLASAAGSDLTSDYFPDFVPVDTRIRNARYIDQPLVNVLRASVDSIRRIYGLEDYNWLYAVNGNQKIQSLEFAEVRKALAPAGTLVIPQVFSTNTDVAFWEKDDDGPLFVESLGNSGYIGYNLFGTGVKERCRLLFVGYMPEWLNEAWLITEAQFKLRPNSFGATSPFDVQLYLLDDQNLTISTADASAPGTLLATTSGPFVANQFTTVTFDPAPLIARAGTVVKFLVAGAAEYAAPIGTEPASPANSQGINMDRLLKNVMIELHIA